MSRVDSSFAIIRSRSFGVSRLARDRPIYPTCKNHSGQFACVAFHDERMRSSRDLRTWHSGSPFARASAGRSKMSRTTRVGGESLKRVSSSRGVIKIRLIYGGRNTNVEHCWDYRRLNCHSFGRGTSHYATHRNKSGQLGAFLLSLFPCCFRCNCSNDVDDIIRTFVRSFLLASDITANSRHSSG